MDLVPFNDKVIVKQKPPETVLKSGIFVPDIATKKSTEGVVVAVGNGKKTKHGNRIPLSVAVNDTVLYYSGSGTVIYHQGEEFLILNDQEILGIIS